MGEYQELRQLSPQGIRSVVLPQAEAALAAVAGDAAEASRSLDLALLEASQAAPDPLPLLCLRCRISQALAAWLIATHRAHCQWHGIELEAMASYALDDDGALTIRTGPERRSPFTYAELASLPAGLISPFSAEVLRSYEPALCGLPHWARLKIQAHNELKAYFRQHGLLLISDWALLRDSSPRRVRQACIEQLSSAGTIDSLCALHTRYRPLYDTAKREYKASTGKASGWQPDLSFLQELAPDQDPLATHEQLKAIARAIRLLLTGISTNSAIDAAALADAAPAPGTSTGWEESEEYSAAELQALINSALQRALAAAVPAMLHGQGKDQALLRCLWAGWAEGLSNRPLAERCGTSCGTVSKKLRPSEHATAIATAAAVELRRHPAFAAVAHSVEGAERLVEALRNHLLSSEQEGDVAPLRHAVANALATPPQP